jgi:hypothetical protein
VGVLHVGEGTGRGWGGGGGGGGVGMFTFVLGVGWLLEFWFTLDPWMLTGQPLCRKAKPKAVEVHQNSTVALGDGNMPAPLKDWTSARNAAKRT